MDCTTTTPAQPTASTSTSSSERRRVLVDYSPKQVALPVESKQSPRGIKSWLASHGSSYLPHDQPEPRQRGSSPRRARPRGFSFQSDSDSDSSCSSDSDAELEDDEAIFLQPRRHLSRQSSAQTGPVSSRPTVPVAPKKQHTFPLYLTAQRPALPVVDLSAASGHLELQADEQLDKSHWSDDEDDLLSEDDEDEETEEDEEDVDGLWAMHPDELDVPALVDDDESGPASTSTRSIPIPNARAPVATGAQAHGLMSRRLASPPARRKASMEGQSFWTPWMDRYLADAARA
jgi:hypothetical protein